jgi:hypothetical protein
MWKACSSIARGRRSRMVLIVHREACVATHAGLHDPARCGHLPACACDLRTHTESLSSRAVVAHRTARQLASSVEAFPPYLTQIPYQVPAEVDAAMRRARAAPTYRVGRGAISRSVLLQAQVGALTPRSRPTRAPSSVRSNSRALAGVTGPHGASSLFGSSTCLVAGGGHARRVGGELRRCPRPRRAPERTRPQPRLIGFHPLRVGRTRRPG